MYPTIFYVNRQLAEKIECNQSRGDFDQVAEIIPVHALPESELIHVADFIKPLNHVTAQASVLLSEFCPI